MYKLSKENREKRRKIILEKSKSSKNLTREKMEEICKSLNLNVYEFKNQNEGCSDIIQISISFKENVAKNFFFSAQPDHACIITSSLANIFLEYLEGKKKEEMEDIVENFLLMIDDKRYELENYPNLNMFSDIKDFQSRIGCTKLVANAIKKIIKDKV